MTPRRLLVFVNIFDRHNDVLGFFVGWVQELASRGVPITVITQQAGEDVSGATIYSLDKEHAPGRIRRAFAYLLLLWKLRDTFDDVLVMMAPGWTILTAFLAKPLGKPLLLWYAVWRGDWRLHVAHMLADKVLCSVREAFPFPSQKLILIGQGIDTAYFIPRPEHRVQGRILFLGRISPVKNLEILLKAFTDLEHDMPGRFLLTIAGGAVRQSDKAYITKLHALAHELGIGDRIVWAGRIPHAQVSRYYQEADIVVNLTPTGSFDKAMLEAMACECLLVASNAALRQFLSPWVQEHCLFREGDVTDLESALRRLAKLDTASDTRLRQELRRVILEHHSQDQWADKLIANLP